jgi:hypothetical protein
VGKCLHKTSTNLLLQLIEVRFNMSHEFDPWAADSFDGREQRSSEREQKREEDGKNTNEWDTMSDCESWSWMWLVPHLVCVDLPKHISAGVGCDTAQTSFNEGRGVGAPV